MAKTMTPATAEPEVGSIGPDGREVLPEFGAEPTREERLQELDERGDALNGQHLVRPSERCGVLAGNGPYAGRRCTYAEHRNDEPHSWEVAMEPPSEQPGHVYDDTAQPTLPGTPEPEQTIYSIPVESQFKGAEFKAASGLEEIGNRLIEETKEFAHLNGIEIRYFWKKRGGKRGGIERFAALTKPGGFAAYALGYPEFALWLAADHCLEHKLTERQIEALVFDRLCQAQTNPDDFSAFRVARADFEGNILTVRKYGLEIFSDLRELGANAKQLNLLDSIDLPLEEAIDQADAEDADDGEDDSE